MLTLKDRLRDLLDRKGIMSVADYEYICRNAPRENGRGYKTSNAERRLRELREDGIIVPVDKHGNEIYGSRPIVKYYMWEHYIAKQAGVPVNTIKRYGSVYAYHYKDKKGIPRRVHGHGDILIQKIKDLNDKKGDK